MKPLVKEEPEEVPDAPIVDEEYEEIFSNMEVVTDKKTKKHKQKSLVESGVKKKKKKTQSL